MGCVSVRCVVFRNAHKRKLNMGSQRTTLMKNDVLGHVKSIKSRVTRAEQFVFISLTSMFHVVLYDAFHRTLAIT